MTNKSKEDIAIGKAETPPESLASEGISCTKPIYKDWERRLLFWVWRAQHKVKSHTEKQGNMTQPKKQNQSPETDQKK